MDDQIGCFVFWVCLTGPACGLLGLLFGLLKHPKNTQQGTTTISPACDSMLLARDSSLRERDSSLPHAIPSPLHAIPYLPLVILLSGDLSSHRRPLPVQVAAGLRDELLPTMVCTFPSPSSSPPPSLR